MSKFNINFNNKDYSIDESTLSEASNSLKQHLSTVMNGEGAVINLGGTQYNIDSAKLNAAKDEFISHLETISGEGPKIMIGGIEYSVDSTKVGDVITGLKNVFDELAAAAGASGFPISWNTLEVMGNTLFDAGGDRYVKISAYIPTQDEVSNSTLTIVDDEKTCVFNFCEWVEAVEGAYTGTYRWRSDDYLESATFAYWIFSTHIDLGDGTIVEPGFYAQDMGTDWGYNADCVIDLVDSGE